jgi:hypothetical protein
MKVFPGGSLQKLTPAAALRHAEKTFGSRHCPEIHQLSKAGTSIDFRRRTLRRLTVVRA